MRTATELPSYVFLATDIARSGRKINTTKAQFHKAATHIDAEILSTVT
jgi:hypothetical protein